MANTSISPALSINAMLANGGGATAVQNSIAGAVKTANTPAQVIGPTGSGNAGVPQSAPVVATGGNGTPVTYVPGASPSAPSTPTSTSTVVSNAGLLDSTIPGNSSTLASTLANTGVTVGADGLARYSDGSFAAAPAGTQPTTDADGNTTYSSGGVNYAIGPSTSEDPAVQQIYDEINAQKAQTDSASLATIQNIEQQYSKLIEDQGKANDNEQRQDSALLTMSGTNKTSDYSGIINGVVSNGLSKISDLSTKEQGLIAAAQVAQANGDEALLDKTISEQQTVNAQKQAAAQKLSDTITAYNQKISAEKTAATTQRNIATIIASGITDPSKILSTLVAQGDTTTSLSDITDAISALNPNQASVLDVMKTAASNGAPQSVLSQIGKATSEADALTAAGSYMQAVDKGLYSLKTNPDGSTTVFNTATGQEGGSGSNSQSNVPDPSTFSITPGSVNTGFPEIDAGGVINYTSTGIPYVDTTNLSSQGKVQAAEVAKEYQTQTGKTLTIASSKIIPVLDAIDSARTDLSNIKTALDPLSPDNGFTRIFDTIGHELEKTTQVGGNAANISSYDTFKASAIKDIQAITGASTGGGARSGTLIAQMMQNIPTINDTKAVAAKKIATLNSLIDSTEQGIFGNSTYSQYNPSTGDSAINDFLGSGGNGSSGGNSALDSLNDQFGLSTPAQ